MSSKKDRLLLARNYSDTMVAWKRYADGPYWSGASCLELGMPWFAPQATFKLIQDYPIFLKRARVLELGAGGSTLFFADLCKEVVSIETNVEWAGNVVRVKPQNSSVVCCESWEQVRSTIQGLPDLFDVALIDGNPEVYSRSLAASMVLKKMKPDAIFIVDNYYLHNSMVDEFTVPSDWTHEDFNDRHWHGCGTRISTRGKVR